MSSQSAKAPVAGDQTIVTHPPALRAPVEASAMGRTTDPGQPTFAVNDLIAERYRIVRFVAKGGMGEVYEAEDLELGDRVALKTVSAHAADDELAIARFKREIHLARKVTHPNVCRIFDVGRHQGTPGVGEVTFLTMELLEGQTLAQRIRHHGPFKLEEAQVLVSQMAEALSAAHRVGIVHRDFKSDNVMLVPSEEGCRVVVTDFGIARPTSSPHELTAHLTSAGDIIGTPSYMAPEQVEGGEVTAAADIYALGVVVFEMLTGKVPFVGGTALATAVKRLTEPAPSPRLHVPDLDPLWEEGILRCLERDPAQRFASASDFLDWLDHDTAEARDPAAAEIAEREAAAAAERERALRAAWEQAVREKKRSAVSHRFKLLVAALLVVASASFVYVRVMDSLEEPSPLALAGLPSGPIRARRSVAVLGFKNRSGQPEVAWLSTGIAEMLSTELAAGGQLRVIPGENVARMRIELALADVDSLASDTLSLIRSNLGTDYVVLGSYVVVGQGNLRLDLRLQDAATGETLAAVAENAPEPELFELVSRVGEQLRSELEVEAPETIQAGSTLPRDPQAARLYSEGLEKLRVFDPLAARQLLEQARTREPDNAMVNSALATALSALGYQDQATAVAKAAYDISAHLPDEERLSVEGQYRVAAQQWQQAIRIYQALWQAFPDNLEYGLQLAAAQTSAGRGDQALYAVEVMRRLPSPASEDPRIDLAEAAATVSLSQFPRQRLASARGAARAQELGASLLVAQAKVMEAEALRHLGRTEEARQACSEAQEIYGTTGNLTGQALALAEMGNILFAGGDYQGAVDGYEKSFDTYTQMGDQSGALRALNNIAVVRRNQGDLRDASRRYQEVLKIAREVRSRQAETAALNNLGAVRVRQGRLEVAQGRFEEALRLARQLGNKSAEASALGNLAVVRRGQGSLDQATNLLEEALVIRRDIGEKGGEISSLKHLGNVQLDGGDLEAAAQTFDTTLEMARTIGSQSLAADALYGSGEVAASRGFLARARQFHEEAMAIRRQLGERGALTESHIALAFLALEEEAPETAEAVVEALVSQLGPDPPIDHGARAQAALAASLLAQNRLPEARRAASEAVSRGTQSETVPVRLEARIHHARVLAADRDPRQATRVLEEVLSQATESGLVGLELEARLALGEIEARTGRLQAARTRLGALQQDALEKGYQRVALKATEAKP